jgi:hypothetical protein
MSVIAWDGKTLAGDMQATEDSGLTVKTYPKVFRISAGNRSYICGVVGRIGAGRAKARWFVENSLDPLPGGSAAVIIIPANHSAPITIVSDSEYPDTLPRDQLFAIGSGAQVAMGAMWAGASAEKAVEAACELDDGCGKGCAVLTID